MVIFNITESNRSLPEVFQKAKSSIWARMGLFDLYIHWVEGSEDESILIYPDQESYQHVTKSISSLREELKTKIRIVVYQPSIEMRLEGRASEGIVDQIFSECDGLAKGLNFHSISWKNEVRKSEGGNNLRLIITNIDGDDRIEELINSLQERIGHLLKVKLVN